MDQHRREQHSRDVVLSIGINLIAVSIFPVWNKHVFNGVFGGTKFDYPLSLTCIQLAMMALMGTLWGTCRHLYYGNEPGARSWIFGPHLMYKLRKISLVGILFGFKYGISNWGLDMIDTPTHVLLQSTDIFWTCLFACLLNKQRVSGLGILAICGTITGSILLSLDLSTGFRNPGTFGLVINLAPPIFLGLCISQLRTGTVALMLEDDSPVQNDMTAIEFATIKIWISSLCVLPWAIIFEQFNALGRTPTPVSEALVSHGWLLVLGLWLGAVLIAFDQTTVVLMSVLTNPITVGIVGSVKCIPRWGASMIFDGISSISETPLNIAGGLVILASSITWATYEVRMSSKDGRGIAVDGQSLQPTREP